MLGRFRIELEHLLATDLQHGQTQWLWLTKTML